MKTYFSFQNVFAFGLVLMLLFTSCQTDEFTEPAVVIEEPTTTETVEETDPTLRINNSLVFPKTANMFGKSTAGWAIEFGKKVYSLNCETIFIEQMLNLGGKVVAPFGSSIGNSAVEYTITQDQHVLLSPAFFFNNYPCPAEYEWEPEEGQSLESFLRDYAKGIIDPIEKVEVFIDGTEIEDPMAYRLSTDLFYFKGNPALVECYDVCVTGEPQPGLIDGYFMMLKKLKVGRHEVLVRGEIPSQDFVYELNLVLTVVK